MQLRQVGELKLLKQLKERFSPPLQDKDRSVLIGIGDDAAVVDPGSEHLSITTDMMNEGVHFDLDFCAPFHLGFKLVSVNVSDIMAMGCRPRYLFLNIALKSDAEEEMFWELYEGISQAMALYGMRLLGGDLTAAVHDMSLSATVIGSGRKVLTRGGASAGDKIYLTAATGDAACGLEILKRLVPESRETVKRRRGPGVPGCRSKAITVCGSPTPSHADTPLLELEWHNVEPLLRRHLMPVARDSAPFLDTATAMIDVSDGLFIDLGRICDESGFGARVYLDRIPLSPGMRYAAGVLGLDSLALAVSGGEDYELLFTAPAGCEVSDALCIGEITAKERVVVDKEGRESDLKEEGYQHFAS